MGWGEEQRIQEGSAWKRLEVDLNHITAWPQKSERASPRLGFAFRSRHPGPSAPSKGGGGWNPQDQRSEQGGGKGSWL